MTQHRDLNGELRAVHTMRLLEDAKRGVHSESGPTGVFVRVTLAIIFMYLIVVSYLMLGTLGVVFVSVLALVSYFVPYMYQASRALLERRSVRKADRNPGTGVPAGRLS